jgi:hypothetical protein
MLLPPGPRAPSRGSRRLALAALAAAAVAAAPAAPAFPPCYAAIDDPMPHLDVLLIETVCFTTIYDFQDTDALRITLRAYPAAAAAAAWVVEASIDDDPGNTFADNLRLVGNYVFDFFSGGNSEILNVTSALTAPFTVRPPVDGRNSWVGAMALAPSLWPAAGKAPPASIIPKIVDVHLFGGVVVAALPLALPAPPTEDDFRSAYKTLELYVSNLPCRPATGPLARRRRSPRALVSSTSRPTTARITRSRCRRRFTS